MSNIQINDCVYKENMDKMDKRVITFIDLYMSVSMV